MVCKFLIRKKVKTVSQHVANVHAESPKPTCHHGKELGFCKNRASQWKREEQFTEDNSKSNGNINGTTSSYTKNNTNNNNNNRTDRKPKTGYLLGETCVKANHH